MQGQNSSTQLKRLANKKDTHLQYHVSALQDGGRGCVRLYLVHKEAHGIATHDGETWPALPLLTLEVDHMGALVRPIRRADRQNGTGPELLSWRGYEDKLL